VRRPPSDDVPLPPEAYGDEWPSLETIVENEWDFVVDVAQSAGVPHGQWEDVALDVFLRYEQHKGTIASPNAIRSWLKTTAFHIAHQYKNAKIARHELPTDPDELEPDDTAPSPEDMKSSQEGFDALVALVGALEPDRRAVFRAYVLEQTPIAEIAAEAGIPEGTAYNRLRLARADLQAALLRARRRAGP
jgi:RNA polymerase sigma-70 factor (ECF subfamily)